jgi:hypothetical protein
MIIATAGKVRGRQLAVFSVTDDDTYSPSVCAALGEQCDA